MSDDRGLSVSRYARRARAALDNGKASLIPTLLVRWVVSRVSFGIHLLNKRIFVLWAIHFREARTRDLEGRHARDDGVLRGCAHPAG
jgi:hypothetical protein